MIFSSKKSNKKQKDKNSAVKSHKRTVNVGTGGHLRYSGAVEDLPVAEDVLIAKSVEFFSDPEPCYIHRSAVRARLYAEFDHWLDSAGTAGTADAGGAGSEADAAGAADATNANRTGGEADAAGAVETTSANRAGGEADAKGTESDVIYIELADMPAQLRKYFFSDSEDQN